MIRLIRNLIFLTFLCIVLLFVYREKVLKCAVRFVVEDITGFSVTIDKIRIGIFRPVLNIENVMVNNPDDFSEKVMMDMPQLYVHYDRSEIFQGKLDFKEIRLTIKEFDVIKNSDGITNIARLKGMAISRKPAQGASSSKAKALKIDLLKLKIGRVVFKDYTVVPPLVKVYPVNINREFRDMTDASQLTRLIVSEALLKANIRVLPDIDIKVLEDSTRSVVATGTNVLTGSTSVATDVAKGAIDTTTTVVKKTVGLLEGLWSFKKKE